ncbi:hypothetical protein WJX72_010452 [[Myrmecia] bisecta]|uniref:Uncharacterized protein n=1 Tax=[Myrmecia] bisecta TaxID=41462 RepID=A0AAW1PK07_9CHLO
MLRSVLAAFARARRYTARDVQSGMNGAWGDVPVESLGTSLSDDVSDEEAKQQFNSDTEPSQGLGSQSSTAEADIALEQASVGGDSLHGDSQLVAPGDDPFAALDSNDGREPTRLRSSVDELVEELVKELRQQAFGEHAHQEHAHRSAILTPPRSGNGSPHRLHSYDASPDHGHQSRSADGVDDDNIYIAALDSRLQQAGQRRLNNREQEVAALRKEVDMLKVHQRDAQLLIQRQQGTNEELEMQKADLAKRLRAAEANMQESEREGSTFRSRWMEASEGFERLQGLLKSRDAECEALRRKAAEDADQLKARADACEREHGRCLALENEVSRLRELCTELERALAAENKRAETIASEERKLDNLCLRLRKDNEMLADKASQADRFCGELRDQVQALTGELKAGERKMSYLNGENEVLRKDNAALNKHLAALDAECAQLRTSLHTAKDEVQDMKERYRQLERAALSFDYSPDKPRRSPPGGPAYPYRTSSIIPAGSFQSPPGVDLNAPSQYAQPSTARGMEDSFDLFTGAPARASGSPRSSYQPARLFPQQVDGGAGDPSGPEHWGSSWERAQESFPPAGQRKASNQPAEYPSRPTYAGDYGPQMAALPAPPPRYPNAHMPAPSSYHPDYPSNPGLSSQQADARFAAEDQHPAYAAEQARAAGYGDVRSAQARADTVGYPDSAPTTSRDSYGQSQPPSHPPPSRAANARSRTGANANRRSPITGVEPGEAMPGSREEQAARGVATDWTARPYGTQLFLDDMMAKTASLEERLMALNMERQQLEAEYARMPPTAGRTIRERNRKAEVEARLEEVAREASNIRLQLKKLGVK